MKKSCLKNGKKRNEYMHDTLDNDQKEHFEKIW